MAANPGAVPVQFSFQIGGATAATVQCSNGAQYPLQWSVDGSAFEPSTDPCNGEWNFVSLPAAALDGGTHTVVGAIVTSNDFSLDDTSTVQVTDSGAAVALPPQAWTQTTLPQPYVGLYGPWKNEIYQEYAQTYSLTAIQFRAQTSSLALWAGLGNGTSNRYRLAIDGVLSPTVTGPAVGALWVPVVLATGLDDTAEHVYTIWAADPTWIDIYSILTSGGTGIDATYEPPTPNYLVAFGDSITQGSYATGDATAGWVFDLCRTVAMIPCDLGIVAESYADLAANPSKLDDLKAAVAGQPLLLTMMGVNDLDGVAGSETVEQFQTNVASYLAAVRGADANVKHVVLGIQPYSGGNVDQRAEWNAAIAAAITASGDPKTVYGGTLETLDPSSDTVDGIHFNAAGASTFAAWLASSVLPPVTIAVSPSLASNTGAGATVTLTPTPLGSILGGFSIALAATGSGELSRTAFTFPAGSTAAQTAALTDADAETVALSAECSLSGTVSVPGSEVQFVPPQPLFVPAPVLSLGAGPTVTAAVQAVWNAVGTVTVQFQRSVGGAAWTDLGAAGSALSVSDSSPAPGALYRALATDAIGDAATSAATELSPPELFVSAPAASSVTSSSVTVGVELFGGAGGCTVQFARNLGGAGWNDLGAAGSAAICTDDGVEPGQSVVYRATATDSLGQTVVSASSPAIEIPNPPLAGASGLDVTAIGATTATLAYSEATGGSGKFGDVVVLTISDTGATQLNPAPGSASATALTELVPGTTYTVLVLTLDSQTGAWAPSQDTATFATVGASAGVPMWINTLSAVLPGGPTICLKRGDTLPQLLIEVQDGAGNAVDLSALAGATLVVRLVDVNGNAVPGAGTLTTSTLNGTPILNYAWASADTATVGTYGVEIVGTLASGQQFTIPDDGRIPLAVQAP